MADDARLAYLQARLQARHGDRPSTDEWRVAEASTNLSHYLEAIRRTALKRWIGDINPDMTPEAIERHLRTAWRDHVDQLAAWSPEDWRPAVQWLRWLPDLPAVDHLLRGRKVPPWMRADPVMRELAFEEVPRRREALAELPLAPVLPTDEAAAPQVVDAWVAEWRRRLPKSARDPESELAGMLNRVRAHLEAMHSCEERHGRALRSLLADQLERSFRRGAGTIIALFSHLVLDGLELERLRAGITSRRLLPERAEGRAWA